MKIITNNAFVCGALNENEALNHIKENFGKTFDPNETDVFLFKSHNGDESNILEINGIEENFSENEIKAFFSRIITDTEAFKTLPYHGRVYMSLSKFLKLNVLEEEKMFEIDCETLVEMIKFLTFAVKHVEAIENKIMDDCDLVRTHCEPLMINIEKVRDELCDIKNQVKEKENNNGR